MNQRNDIKQFNLRIDAVANGYMVRTALDMNSDRSYALIEDTKVFESFDSLVGWLKAYLPIYPVFDPTEKYMRDLAKRQDAIK